MRKILSFISLFFAALIYLHLVVKDNLNFEALAEAAGIEDREAEEEEERERRTDQPDKFLEYHRGIRTRADQSAPRYSGPYKWLELRKARQNQSMRLKNGRSQSNGVLEWKERGPANVPGRIRALYNVPSDGNNNTWLAGAATGGIWRTTDGGTTWSERSADFPVLPISCFAADNAGSTIYAGTGEFVSSVFSALGNGIFKSTDNGITWAQLPATANNPKFTIITRLIVQPDNANTLLATTAPSNLAGGKSYVMRSTDGGATWTQVHETEGAFEQIIASPGNFATQFVAEKGVGVWKSIDAGLHWSLSNNGMQPSGRLEIAISPVNPQKMFVSSEGTLSGSESDLYCSSNGGASWSLVDVKFSGSTVDFLQGQGYYDNAILAHPFIENDVYFGGVSMFKTSVQTTASSNVTFFSIQEDNTTFLTLQAFSNATQAQGRLTVGPSNTNATVEVRFGPGTSQKAHRFQVPSGSTSGVLAANYAYSDYVTVPFEVWDVTTNRQLMVSFRDQNSNGVFDLVPVNLDGASNIQSREYLYIHNVAYNASTPAASVALNGGQEVSLMYNIYPALASGESWTPASLPSSKIVIRQNTMEKLSGTTVVVADGRGDFDKKNTVNQINLEQGVHPDHHYMISLVTSPTAKTFRILLANDGGVFVSKSATMPGTTEGDWSFKGFGLNTSQFYGADKMPGKQRYIGGMQDNGTRISKVNEDAGASTRYSFAVAGDGFEVLWNSKNPKLILGSSYNSQISRSADGGATWSSSTSGFAPNETEFPFLTKLANSKDFPDRVFTVGASGVYRSENFGSSWQQVAIPSNFVIGSPFYLDVEVSRANANIVWAGSGMNNTGNLRYLHVSTDGGKTFSPTNNFTQTPLGNITKLASHPTEPNTAYALFSFADSPKILRTTDLGESWQDISGFGSNDESATGFPDVAVYCLYVRPDNPNILWAGTEIGIVESLNNGATWALVNDFINVSVWDIRGQDDEIVLATHGRGIWTAKVSEVQEAIQSPIILAAGTSPTGNLAVRIKNDVYYDSLVLMNGSVRITSVKNASNGTRELFLSNQNEGSKDLKVIGYAGTAPHQSMNFNCNHYRLLAGKSSYSTYFTSVADLALSGLQLETFASGPASQRKTLHTNHFYSTDTKYEVFLKTPITVSSIVPSMYYSDIAVIEPDNDFVVVEATENGLDWKPLAPKYDAAFSGDTEGKWLTTYLARTNATIPMFINHEINITDTFTPGALVLFRFRMISSFETTAWGWALNYIAIQEPPVSTELFSNENLLNVFPNPSRGNISLQYTLENASHASIDIVDIFGKSVYKNHFEQQNAGDHLIDVNLSSVPVGHYIVVLRTSNGKLVRKVLITK